MSVLSFLIVTKLKTTEHRTRILVGGKEGNGASEKVLIPEIAPLSVSALNLMRY